MAFTKITVAIKGTFGTGNGAVANAIFYPEDVAIVLNQPGANAVQLRDAIVGGEDCAVFVGVTAMDANGATHLLDEIDDLIALPCPPFNDPKGGVRKTF